MKSTLFNKFSFLDAPRSCEFGTCGPLDSTGIRLRSTRSEGSHAFHSGYMQRSTWTPTINVYSVAPLATLQTELSAIIRIRQRMGSSNKQSNKYNLEECQTCLVEHAGLKNQLNAGRFGYWREPKQCYLLLQSSCHHTDIDLHQTSDTLCWLLYIQTVMTIE